MAVGGTAIPGANPPGTSPPGTNRWPPHPGLSDCAGRMGSLVMIMANVDDPQYAKDRDAAYFRLSREMWKVIGAYQAETNLRRAMEVYNEGAALAQERFREALRKAKEDQAGRARGDMEDSW